MSRLDSSEFSLVRNNKDIAVIIEDVYNYLFVFFLLLQIRAEKPYYMADPEVDSLVSLISLSTVII